MPFQIMRSKRVTAAPKIAIMVKFGDPETRIRSTASHHRFERIEYN
ncbi:MAG: hypothetical protein ABW128_22270 [Rhizorhabdus sp.]